MPVPLSRYVYLFRCGEYHKIGRSDNPKKRAKALDHFALPVEIVCIIDAGNGQRLEQFYHNIFKEYRIRNEWFKLPDEAIDQMLNDPRLKIKYKIGECGHYIEKSGYNGRCWNCRGNI
jgi:hypothetical protein